MAYNKPLAAFAALAFCGALVAGCQQKEEADTAAMNTDTSTTASTMPPADTSSMATTGTMGDTSATMGTNTMDTNTMGNTMATNTTP